MDSKRFSEEECGASEQFCASCSGVVVAYVGGRSSDESRGVDFVEELRMERESFLEQSCRDVETPLELVPDESIECKHRVVNVPKLQKYLRRQEYLALESSTPSHNFRLLNQAIEDFLKPILRLAIVLMKPTEVSLGSADPSATL